MSQENMLLVKMIRSQYLGSHAQRLDPDIHCQYILEPIVSGTNLLSSNITINSPIVKVYQDRSF